MTNAPRVARNEHSVTCVSGGVSLLPGVPRQLVGDRKAVALVLDGSRFTDSRRLALTEHVRGARAAAKVGSAFRSEGGSEGGAEPAAGVSPARGGGGRVLPGQARPGPRRSPPAGHTPAGVQAGPVPQGGAEGAQAAVWAGSGRRAQSGELSARWPRRGQQAWKECPRSGGQRKPQKRTHSPS